MNNVKIENVEIFGFEHAMRNMRNPLESWAKNDSSNKAIGPKDLELLLKLVKNGDEHAKVLRTITVCFDMTIPRYVLTEVDTYKIGTVRNSCSTMHKLGKRDLVPEDFAATDDPEEYEYLLETIRYLNALGAIHRETKDYKIVKRLKRLLPEGFLQKSGFCTNYAVLLRMFFQRKNHRLDEWRLTDGPPEASICNWIQSLPYMAQIIEAKEKK